MQRDCFLLMRFIIIPEKRADSQLEQRCSNWENGFLFIPCLSQIQFLPFLWTELPLWIVEAGPASQGLLWFHILGWKILVTVGSAWIVGGERKGEWNSPPHCSPWLLQTVSRLRKRARVMEASSREKAALHNHPVLGKSLKNTGSDFQTTGGSWMTRWMLGGKPHYKRLCHATRPAVLCLCTLTPMAASRISVQKVMTGWISEKISGHCISGVQRFHRP